MSAPAWVYLGWWARKHRMLHRVWEWSARAQLGTICVIAAIVVLWVGVGHLRRRARRKAGLPSEPPDVAPLRAVEGGRGPR